MKLTLDQRRQETSDVSSFLFQPASPFERKSGQFMVFKLDHPSPDKKGVERYFTLSSAPQDDHVAVTTRDTGSSFKRALFGLRKGDEIEGRDLDGEFILARPDAQNAFIAGGIGITPFHAILHDFEHRGIQIHAKLLYGNRGPEVVFGDDLARLESEWKHFSVERLTAPNIIDEASIRKAFPNLPDWTFYVSGPEPMVESLEKTMASMGIDEARMIRDYFPGYDSANY